jgi:hypothetical protein
MVALPLIAAIAGCQAAGDIKHATNGIGDDLYSSDLALATRNLETYFGFICRQANIPTISGPDSFPNCDYASIDSEGWTVVVQTGFNDIDRRCDGYLEWLEEARHRAVFVNSQINSAGRLTNQILTAVVPSAGLAIGIVSEAFGFAKSAFNDYQTLIMLGYEPSTIKTIVSERRLAFRVQFSSVVFKYKPDAVNVLRSYLRICMPYTITMDANTYARALATGNGLPNYVNSSIERDTIVGENALAGPITATTGVFNPDRGEGTSSPPVVARINKAVQEALCVKGDGEKGPRTTEAIKVFQYVRQEPETGELSVPDENAIINTLGACNAAFENFLERFDFANRPDNPDALAGLRDDLTKLAAKAGATVTISNEDTLETLRPKIETIKKALGPSFFKTESQEYLNRQFTPDLQRLLLML